MTQVSVPTREAARARAKAEKLQAHWVIRGEIAMVYNIASGSRYTVRTKHLGSSDWMCTCKWAQLGKGGWCKHVVRVIDKATKEGLV